MKFTPRTTSLFSLQFLLLWGDMHPFSTHTSCCECSAGSSKSALLPPLVLFLIPGALCPLLWCLSPPTHLFLWLSRLDMALSWGCPTPELWSCSSAEQCPELPLFLPSLDHLPSIPCCPLWPSSLFPYKNLPSSLPFLFSSPSPSLCFPPVLPNAASSSACLVLSPCWEGALHPPRLEGIFLLCKEVQDYGFDLCNCRRHCNITTNFVTQNFLPDAYSQQ